MKKLFVTLIFMAAYMVGFAQAGNLNPNFGNAGVVRTDFGSLTNMYGDFGKEVLVHPDGSFYIVFEMAEQTIVAHFLQNGTLNMSYGEKGYSVPVSMRNPSAAMQPDGKIVVGGFRFNDNYDFAVARFNTNGTLDKSFSGDGQLTTDFGAQEQINSIALQSDGKILASGYTYASGINDFVLARYNTDGSPDNSFSGDGKLTTEIFDNAAAVAIQNDGKIVAAGNSSSSFILVIRYLPDGTFDNSFSGDGKETLSAAGGVNALAIQPDQKILLAGLTASNINQDFLLIRLNTDASFDNSFSGDGIQITDLGTTNDAVQALALQSDGKIIAAGGASLVNLPRSAIARYNIDGSLDHTFTGDGFEITPVGYVEFLYSVAVQPNGKILTAGWADVNFSFEYFVVRYNTDGSLDATFDGDGKSTGYMPAGITYYYTSALQADGKIVAAGFTGSTSKSHFAIARYNTNGTLDNTFSGDGMAVVEFGSGPDVANAVVIQNDGKVVIAGSAFNGVNPDFALVRLNSDGTPDNSFSGDGKLMVDMAGGADGAGSIAIQPDGKIVVAGSNTNNNNTDFALARLNVNGTLDNSFSGDGKLFTNFGSNSDYANTVMIQTDGKIVAAGSYNSGTGNADFAAARYNNDGSPDATFDGDGKVITNFFGGNDVATSALLQPDGKVLMAGGITNNNGNELAMLRYNADGSLDNSFSGDGKLVYDGGSTSELLNDVVLQPDGKIIAGGQFGGSNNDLIILRFNVDGTPDNSFSGDGKVVMDLGYGEDIFYSLSLGTNLVYGVGRTIYGGTDGLIASFITNPCTVSVFIPDAMTLSSGVDANTVYMGYAPASDLTLTAQTNGGNAPYTYSWGTGATSQSITVFPTLATSYSVTVTDAFGCSTSASKLVNVVDVRCGNKMDKVSICKVPPGNPSNANTNCISANAVPAHLKNGSYLGNCNANGNALTRAGITEEAMEVFGLTASPNPSSTLFKLNITGCNGQAELIVRDAIGRLIENRTIRQNGSIEIGAAYGAGIYIVELEQGNETAVLKLIKH